MKPLIAVSVTLALAPVALAAAGFAAGIGLQLATMRSVVRMVRER